jgi:hypothetical protein
MPAPFLTPIPLVARAWLSCLRDSRTKVHHSGDSPTKENHKVARRGAVEV